MGAGPGGGVLVEPRLVAEPLARGEEVADCCAVVGRLTLDLRLEPKPRLFSRELMLSVT